MSSFGLFLSVPSQQWTARESRLVSASLYHEIILVSRETYYVDR